MDKKFDTNGWPLWNWVAVHSRQVMMKDAEEGEMLVLLRDPGEQQQVVTVVDPKKQILKDADTGESFVYTRGVLYEAPPLKKTGGRKTKRRITRRRKTHRRR